MLSQTASALDLPDWHMPISGLHPETRIWRDGSMPSTVTAHCHCEVSVRVSSIFSHDSGVGFVPTPSPCTCVLWLQSRFALPAMPRHVRPNHFMEGVILTGSASQPRLDVPQCVASRRSELAAHDVPPRRPVLCFTDRQLPVANGRNLRAQCYNEDSA